MKISVKNRNILNKKLRLYGAIAGTSIIIISSVCAINSSSNDEEYINEIISSSTTFESILYDVSDLTDIDDILSQTSYLDYLDEYKRYRVAEDFENSKTSLSKLGECILKASICESTGIDISSITEFECTMKREKNGFNTTELKAICVVAYTYTGSKIVNGGIIVDNSGVTVQNFALEDEAFDLCYNICNLKDNEEVEKEPKAESFTFNTIDSIFLSFERYLLTSTEVSSNRNNKEQTFIAEYDKKKIKVLKKFEFR